MIEMASMGTPSTIYTTPKQTPLTARGTLSRGSKALDQTNATTKNTTGNDQSIKTINESAARNILKNGIKVLGESPMKTIQIDLTPARAEKIEPRASKMSD